MTRTLAPDLSRRASAFIAVPALLSALALPAIAQDATPPAAAATAVAGEPSKSRWPVSGKADLPDGTLIQVDARRIERQWDAKAGQFVEILSEQKRKYANAIVTGKAYAASLPVGPTGFYALTVASREDNRPLLESRATLGRVDDLLRDSPARIRRLSALIDKSRECRDGMAGKPLKKCQDDLLKLDEVDRELAELLAQTDLSAFIALMQQVCFYLRNRDAGPPGTADALMKTAGRVLSLELRLSTAVLVDDRFERAGTEAGRLAAATAKALADEAPEKDEAFVTMMDQVATARDEKETADARTRLRGVISSLLRKL